MCCGFSRNRKRFQVLKSNFTSSPGLCDAPFIMWKKFLKLLPVLLITGCAAVTTITPLTPEQLPRNAKNQYLVEATLASDQTTLRWDSLECSVVVGGKILPMTPVAKLNNRWEGYIPVPPDQNTVTYRFLFDYKYNNLGSAPRSDTKTSAAYTLKIAD